MSIKEVYKTLLMPRYNNKKYYNAAIEFDYSPNVIRIASPNCSTRLILKPTFNNNNNLIQLQYALSGDMFAFVVTELIIDFICNHTKNESKLYLNNLVNRVNTNTDIDEILISNYQNSSINKILGYFTNFIDRYWN